MYDVTDSYVVIEILHENTQHKHLKGTKSGIRVNVAESLKQLKVIQDNLDQRVCIKEGTLRQVLQKQTAPIVQMAQALIN